MASSFKRTYYKPTTSGMDVAYTVPTVSSAVVLSAIATPTNGEDKTVSVGVAPTGSTDINWVSRNVPVYNGSSVNLVPDRMALNTGDRIVVNSTADLMQFIQSSSSLPITAPTSIAVNTSGSIIVIGGTDGLAMSSDGGLSFTKVSNVAPTNTGFNLLKYFSSKFIYFASGSTIYTSTDGITWTTISQGIFPTSQISENASKLVGINNGSLYESTDGTTWAAIVTNGYPTNMRTCAEVNINFVYYNSTTGFFACGDNGVVFRCGTTPGAENWTQVPTGISDNLYGIYFSTALYIVGDAGRIITTSTYTAAAIFTIVTAVTTESLRAITFNGLYWVACGTNGTILTSTAPSSTWTARTSGVSVTLNAVSFSASNNALVVGDAGTILYETATSGATWVAKTSGTSENLNGVVYSSTGTVFIVVGNNGVVLTATSAATTWTSRTSGTSENLYSVSQSGSTTCTLIAGANGTLLGFETRGSVFTFVALRSGTTSTIKSIFTGSQGVYSVYVGSSGLFGQSTTEFGTSQTLSTSYMMSDLSSGTSTKFNSIAVLSGQLVAVGDSGIIYTAITSAPSTWTSQTSGVAVNLNTVVSTSTGFVAVGDTGTILTGSSNGVTWTSRTSNTTNNLYGITFNNGATPALVAVGAGGVIRTSDSTGVTWTSQTNADTANLRAIVYNSTTPNWVAVGDSGRVLVGTTSATTWTTQTSGTANTLRSVSWISGIFIAVGDAGTVITATNAGVTWAARPSATVEHLYASIEIASAIPGLSGVYNGITCGVFGNNGIMVTSPTANSINFLNRKLNISTAIYGCIDTGTFTVAVGASGKIYLISCHPGGFQESYVLRPVDIPSISSTTTHAVAAGSYSTLYTSGTSASTNKWNTLIATTGSAEMNYKKAIWNGTNWIFVGNNGAVMLLSGNPQTGTPTMLSTQTNTNIRGGVYNSSNNIHVLVGEDGGIFTSTTATGAMILTKRTSGTTQDLNEIATKSTLYVVVGNAGTILTSSDSGVTWTPRTSGTSEHLLSVAYNATLDIFIAVGANGTILTGNNTGVTWTARTSGTTKKLNGVFFANGAVPVAVGDTGTILYSTAASLGATWTSVTPVVDHDLLSGCTLPSSTQNYISGRGYTILDATTITSPAIRSSYTPSFTVTSSTFNTGASTRFILVGTNGMIMYSLGRPGLNMLFTPKFSGVYTNLNDITSVNFGGNQQVAVGDSGVVVQCTTSPVWSYINSNTTQHLYGVGSGLTTNCLAVGAAGTIVYGAPSINVTWTVATTPGTTNRLNAVSNMTGIYWVAVGVSGTIVGSGAGENPATWSLNTSGTTETLNSVRTDSTNSVVTAVGTNGIIKTSSVGNNSWTTQASGVTTDLTDISGHLVAGNVSIIVGKGGTYLYSTTPASSWTSASTGTTADLVTVALNSGNFPIFVDSNSAVYAKDTGSYSSAITTRAAPKAVTAQVSLTNTTLISYLTPINTTSYTVYLGLQGKTIVAKPQTSTTAVTDITSVGDGSNTIFFVAQTTGNVKYTSDFVTMTDLGISGTVIEVIGDRIIVGADTVYSLPQATVTTAPALANSLNFGPTLATSNNFARFNNTALGFDSSNNLWQITDITSTVPRGGLQFVVSTTEIV